MDMGRVISAGVRIAREQPKVVAIWAAIYIALLLPFGLFVLPGLKATMAGNVEGMTPTTAIGHMGGLFLYYLIMLAVLLVLNNASYRAVLRPDDSDFAYLRVGMDELRILGLGIVFFLGFFVIILVLAIAFGLAGGIGVLASGTVPSGRGAAWAIVIGFIVYIVAALLSVRFALAFPLTVLRRKLVIGEAWRRSRGHFWPLLGSFIVVALIYLIAATMLSLLTGGGAGMAMMFNADRMRELSEGRDAAALGTGFTILSLIASGISGTLWIVLSGCGLAMAARELTDDTDEELAQVWA